jgi:hypothetical protein
MKWQEAEKVDWFLCPCSCSEKENHLMGGVFMSKEHVDGVVRMMDRMIAEGKAHASVFDKEKGKVLTAYVLGVRPELFTEQEAKDIDAYYKEKYGEGCEAELGPFARNGNQLMLGIGQYSLVVYRYTEGRRPIPTPMGNTIVMGRILIVIMVLYVVVMFLLQKYGIILPTK